MSEWSGYVRKAEIERKTEETAIRLSLVIDGTGRVRSATGVGFLDHMLVLFAHHGLFDLEVTAQGDLQVDAHHTVEDVAICLGQAIDRGLGDRSRIVRTGHSYVPMDETLGFVAVDLGGRPYAVIETGMAGGMVQVLGGMDADLVRHFLETVAMRSGMNLHARILYGLNDHHKAEALFKAFGRALDAATQVDARRAGLPSSKGMIA